MQSWIWEWYSRDVEDIPHISERRVYGIKMIEDRTTRVGFQLNSYTSDRLKRTSKRMRELKGG